MAGTGDTTTGGEPDDGLTLLAVTHGPPSPANRAAIVSLVEGVAGRLRDRDVTIDFIDSREADVASALAMHRRTGAVIVPLVLSAGFHVRAGLALGIERMPPGGPVLADPLGPDARLVTVLRHRLAEADVARDDVVLLAAAGSNDPRAVRECFETGRLLGARLGRAVTVGFVAAAIPRLPDAIDMVREVHPGSRIVVATYLLAPGAFNDAVHAVGADVVTTPLLRPHGAPPVELVDLVADRYLAAAALRRRRTAS